ncbi:MAG: hypothetical protein JO006_13160 [Paucibacter sp.]|nr:hypothetical protein [Roseateles sp.]
MFNSHVVQQLVTGHCKRGLGRARVDEDYAFVGVELGSVESGLSDCGPNPNNLLTKESSSEDTGRSTFWPSISFNSTEHGGSSARLSSEACVEVSDGCDMSGVGVRLEGSSVEAGVTIGSAELGFGQCWSSGRRSVSVSSLLGATHIGRSCRVMLVSP